MKDLVSGDKIKALVYQQSGSLAHAISGQTELTINRVIELSYGAKKIPLTAYRAFAQCSGALFYFFAAYGGS